jgi:hypothetical protein
MNDEHLLKAFIDAFSKLGDTMLLDPTTLPPEMDAGFDDSPWALQRWRPAVVATDAALMQPLYEKLPGRFPPLYEKLILSYRWLEIDLGDVIRLLANPPGLTLSGLGAEIAADPVIVDVLFPLGFIPFGKASDSYDPICFDAKRAAADGDCPIIRIEHEAVLCHSVIGERQQIADSFRGLVEKVVDLANSQPKR